MKNYFYATSERLTSYRVFFVQHANIILAVKQVDEI